MIRRSRAPHAFWIAVMVAAVLNPLNSSTLSVAMPLLLRVLHTSAAGITWIISAYYLGSAVAQPMMGKLGDHWGQRRLITGGLILVVVSAIGAPLSRSLPAFALWRLLQAIGTSMLYPNAIGLVRRHFPATLASVLGWVGLAAGLAVAVGPPLGGLLLATVGWPALFWLNLPMAILAWWGFRKLSASPVEALSPEPFRWDYVGSLTLALGVGGLLGVLNRGSWGGIFGGLALLSAVLFIAHESRTPSPLLPLNWFRRPEFRLGIFMTVFGNQVMYMILYGLPLYLTRTRHFTATQNGWLLLLFAGVIAVGSPLGGRQAKKPASLRPWMVLTAVALLLGTGLEWLGGATRLMVLGVGLVFVGFSFAVTNVILQHEVIRAVPGQESGSAAGVFTLFRYLGTILASLSLAWAFSHHGAALFAIEALASGLVLLGSGFWPRYSDRAADIRGSGPV
ncbi:MAG: MFS transporter [Sulfobacillus sp.]|nr:MFS transporter [Sulfobacillus sp.]